MSYEDRNKERNHNRTALENFIVLIINVLQVLCYF